MADIILIVILALGILIGRHMGFLKGLVNLVCIGIAAIGGYLLYPYVSSFLMDTPLYGTILKPVTEYITNNYLSGTPMNNVNSMFIKYGVTTLEALFVKMAEGITVVIINIISIVAIFVLLRVVLMTVKFITSLITKLPVIHGLDKLLGMTTGFISSLLIVYLMVAVMMIPPCNKSEISQKMCEYIDNSVITKNVMDYNIFINYDSLSEMGEV